MFANVLYFLIALVIYTTAELFGPGSDPDAAALLHALLISAAFVLVCKLSFLRLARKMADFPFESRDHWIGIYINRLSILALIVFTVNIYGFRIYAGFNPFFLFDLFPTLKALCFLVLFIAYLAVVWEAAYAVQKEVFSGRVSKKQFIASNLAFALPAMLPWFVLSMVSDMFMMLPWQPARAFLQSPAGEFAYILFFLVAVAVFGPALIRRLWRCRPLADTPVRDRIEHLCQSAGLKYSDILVWELFGGAMITAGVMGLVGRFRYLLVTPALLDSLSGRELDAVILHEIGHVQRHHMVFYLFFFAGFAACNYVFFEPALYLLYVLEPVYRAFETIGISKTTAHPVMFVFLLLSFFILYFRFGFGLFMRNFERQADIHLYRFIPDASALISTFYKIAAYSKKSMEAPNWHHFSIGQRIRFLQACQENPWLIRDHHSKVRKLMISYTALILLVFTAGWAISHGPAKDRFEHFIAQKILLQNLAVDPENADLYVLVGDYYYSRESYAKAVDAYENVIKVAPDNIHALNNLSWLLATCPEESFRDYERALELAEQALARKREDYILDTYAEALFANQQIDRAVAAAKEALAMTKTKKAYYEDQLKRFEAGLAQ